jgi:hypothetical protein
MDHILNKAFLATGGAVAYKQFQVVKQVAESTLQPAQCAIYDHGGGAKVLGVVQEPLDAVKTATGKAFVGVALSGNSKCIVGVATNVAVGNYVVPSATIDGAVDAITGLVGTSAGQSIVGKIIGVAGNSIGQSATAGDIIDVELMVGQILYAT